MQTQQTTSPASERLVRTLAALLLAVSLCLPSLSGCAGIESVANGGSAASSQQVSSGNAAAKLSDIPEYSGALCIDINEGQPGFSADDAARGSFLDFSELDFEGRCGTAAGLIGPETVSNAERGDISQVHPSGWVQHRYSFVDREMLYNRSHLIAHQLCGEDANERNLITGTRTMNAVGMTYYEELVGNYVRRTNNHVLYRVTPLFAANDLVARGVQMEAESVEDGGQAIRFNVFVYNVEPGVKIDYVTGDNWESSEVPAVKTKGEATTTRGTGGDAALSQYAASKGEAGASDTSGSSDTSSNTQAAPSGSSDAKTSGSSTSSASTAEQQTYILNKRSHKFHRPECDSVQSMSPSNKEEFTGLRQTLIDEGYTPCRSCNP
ncbi:DNA/RNA non-specific endonuclease [Ellagibacter isourolithinifaciens]|uniref:DNA/RNA non-specific endonuclease n=1 Tax=Ellagibacter isourolithinifaciens TaxID=2137581 RepID=UPI003AEF613F